MKKNKKIADSTNEQMLLGDAQRLIVAQFESIFVAQIEQKTDNIDNIKSKM